MSSTGGPKVNNGNKLFGYDTGRNPSSSTPRKRSRYFEGPPTTNILNYGTDFSSWTGARNSGSYPTVIPNATLGPFKKKSEGLADLLIIPNDGTYPRVYQSFTPANTNSHTISVWLKSVKSTGKCFIGIFRQSPWSLPASQVFNITNKWKKYSFTFNPMDTTAHQVYIGSHDGEKGQQYYIWGALLEQSSFASPYTDTTRLSTSGLINTALNPNEPEVFVNGNEYPIEVDAYGKWVKVFRHYNNNGSVLFTSTTEAQSSNEGNQSADKFSILGQLEKFRRKDGKLKLKLYYPEYPDRTNIWYQTSNPTYQSIAGYQAILTGYSGNYWGGLEYYGTSTTFINGSVGHSNWYFAIGSFDSWSGAIPGPGVPVNYAEVYACVEDTNLSNNNIDLTNISYNSDGYPVFDGTNDYIVTDQLSGRNPTTSPFTVEAIVKANTTSSSMMWVDVDGNGSNQRFYSSLVTANRPGNFGTQSSAWSHGTCEDMDYHHQVIVMDGTTARVYDNGTQVGTRSYSSYTLPANIRIGSRSGTSYFWNGEIPVFKIYDKALSADEVSQNYKAYKNRFNI